jgi:hypothetical protein
LLPLLETEIMMPMPITIATPIKVHAVPMLCRIPNFQSAARRPRRASERLLTPPLRRGQGLSNNSAAIVFLAGAAVATLFNRQFVDHILLAGSFVRDTDCLMQIIRGRHKARQHYFSLLHRNIDMFVV